MAKTQGGDLLTQLTRPLVAVITGAVSCANCSWTGVLPDDGEDLQLFQIDDLATRVEPGEEVPACQCPECGCLAYLDGTASLSTVTKTLCDTLASIRDHSKEFGEIEDFEARCARISEKARETLKMLADAGVGAALTYVEPQPS